MENSFQYLRKTSWCEECTIFALCPLTNVVLLLYYFISVFYIIDYKDVCNESNVWWYNLFSFIWIFITNIYWIQQVFGSVKKIIIRKNYPIHAIIYLFYLGFIVLGFIELLKLEKCDNRNKIPNIVICFNIIIHIYVSIVITVSYINILLCHNNKIEPQNEIPEIIIINTEEI